MTRGACRELASLFDLLLGLLLPALLLPLLSPRLVLVKLASLVMLRTAENLWPLALLGGTLSML